jgi:hypothetical protein
LVEGSYLEKHGAIDVFWMLDLRMKN